MDVETTEVLINADKLPVIIGSQVEELNKLNEKVNTALEKARKAQSSANTAKNKTINFLGYGKTAAIEALQSSGYDLSEALISSAEAHKIGFEFQTKLAEITKYLFALGVTSLAQNRMVVRELELKLKGASASQLSELARKEVLNVVMQLKAQEDILCKQERLTIKVKSIDNQLQSQVEKDEQHDELLRLQAENDKQHDEQMQRHAEIDRQHNEMLRLQTEKDKQHDEQLARRAEIDLQHDEAMSILVERCLALERTISSMLDTQKTNQENIRLNSISIERQEASIKQLVDEVTNSVMLLNRKFVISLAIAVSSLLGIVVLCVLKFS